VVINNRWLIGNVFNMEFGNESELMPNFIEVSDDDSIIIKSNYFKKSVPFSGGNSIGNFNSHFDSTNQRVFLAANIGAPDETWLFCYDSSFSLLWKKIYTYPVNKVDSIYTKMQINGIQWFNNQFYLYGVKQEFLRFNRHGPNKPFIFPVSMLDEQIVLGKKELNANQSNPIVYPNPFKDELNLKNVEGKYNLSIFDPMGAVVLSKMFDGEHKIKLVELETGLYFYIIQTSKGQIHSGKIIKE
jgi:hypothetical protein